MPGGDTADDPVPDPAQEDREAAINETVNAPKSLVEKVEKLFASD